MSTSMTGYDTTTTVYPTPQYGYEGEISCRQTGAVTPPHCVQVTPDRRAGEEFSTSQLITNNNCRARDLRQRDTTTTILGEQSCSNLPGTTPFLVSHGKAQTKLPSFNSAREELGLIDSFDGSGTLITSSGVTPVTILDIQDVEIVSL